jgi:hypothetical protein
MFLLIPDAGHNSACMAFGKRIVYRNKTLFRKRTAFRGADFHLDREREVVYLSAEIEKGGLS